MASPPHGDGPNTRDVQSSATDTEDEIVIVRSCPRRCSQRDRPAVVSIRDDRDEGDTQVDQYEGDLEDEHHSGLDNGDNTDDDYISDNEIDGQTSVGGGGPNDRYDDSEDDSDDGDKENNYSGSINSWDIESDVEEIEGGEEGGGGFDDGGNPRY